MNSYQLRQPKRRSAVLLGAAAMAMAIGGLASPPVSHAVWDIGAYDSCMAKASDRYASGKTDIFTFEDEKLFCCQSTGGEFTSNQGCTAPPLTGPPVPRPGEVIQAPGTGTARQDSPVGQAPEAGTVPATSTAPRPPIVRDHRQR